MVKLIVDANAFNNDYSFGSMLNISASDLKAKADYETGELKLEEGKPQFKVPVTAITKNKEGVERLDANVGVHVLNPVDIQAGVIYKLAGKVRITPYAVTSGSGDKVRANVAYSVIADSLVPVKGDDQK